MLNGWHVDSVSRVSAPQLSGDLGAFYVQLVEKNVIYYGTEKGVKLDSVWPCLEKKAVDVTTRLWVS
jgi:hypothetical protein